MGSPGLLLATVMFIMSANSLVLRHKREVQEKAGGGSCTDPQESHTSTQPHHSVALAMWRWEDFGIIIVVLLLLMVACFIKVITLKTSLSLLNLSQLYYHRLPYLSHHMPESCFLILLGVSISTITHYGFGLSRVKNQFIPQFNSNLFFNVLLPPIILDSAFGLYSRDFLSNVPSIMTFAIVGTIFNTFAVGLSLQALIWSNLLGPLSQDGPTNTTLDIRREFNQL